jgi:hypothetical protein
MGTVGIFLAFILGFNRVGPLSGELHGCARLFSSVRITKFERERPYYRSKDERITKRVKYQQVYAGSDAVAQF